MGWFRKVFFHEGEPPRTAPPAPTPAPAPPAPAPPAPASPAAPETAPQASADAAPLDDPYRGAAFVEVDAVDEVVTVGKAKPIFHWRGRVLALEANRRGPLPLRSMVYTGLTESSTLVLRRVTFGEGGYRIDWEHHTPFPEAHDGYVGRIGDRIVVPRATGVVAFHVVTGGICWELPHPAALEKQPRIDRDGNLILVFTDQSWMVVSVRDGATVTEGVARNNRDLEELRGGTDFERNDREAHYAGRTVSTSRDGIVVRSGKLRADDDPVAPNVGTYPLEGEWEAKEYVALAAGKLAVDLGREWGEQKWAAVGLLDPTSLEPLQLLELGKVTTSVRCWVVDDLLVLDTDVPEDPDDVMFVVDPAIERVVAVFREYKADGYLFDKDGARIWAKPL